MNKYIKCDEKFIDEAISVCSSSVIAAIKMKEFLQNYPASDVEEVKYGVWMLYLDEADYEHGECSICGYKERDAFPRGDIPHRCINCSAKMTGVVNGY